MGQTIEDEIAIDADAATVWGAIKDTAAHAAWHPMLTGIEGEHESGSRRRCSVRIGNRTGESVETCITERPFEEIAWRVDEDSSGFLKVAKDWTAGFSLRPHGNGTVVTARSRFTPRNPIASLLLPLIRRRFHTAQRDILTGLKTFVEESR